MGELILNFDMIDKILQKVGFYNFNPSDVDFTVAGYPMSDFTSLTIVPTQRRVTIQGIDRLYHTYADLPSYYKISFSLLAVCKDVEMMELLATTLNEKGGGFEVVIKSNGRFVGNFRGYFELDSADSFNEEANDKTYDIVAIKTEANIIQSDLGDE